MATLFSLRCQSAAPSLDCSNFTQPGSHDWQHPHRSRRTGFWLLFTWAWQEQGVNYFRRALGLIVLLGAIASRLQWSLAEPCETRNSALRANHNFLMNGDRAIGVPASVQANSRQSPAFQTLLVMASRQLRKSKSWTFICTKTRRAQVGLPVMF